MVTRERSIPAAGESRLLIIDERTGEVLVERPISAYGGRAQRAKEPQRGTLCKHHIVFGTDAAVLRVFRLSDGEPVSRHEHRDLLFYPVYSRKAVFTPRAPTARW
jgi:hypothetical protein